MTNSSLELEKIQHKYVGELNDEEFSIFLQEVKPEKAAVIYNERAAEILFSCKVKKALRLINGKNKEA